MAQINLLFLKAIFLHFELNSAFCENTQQDLNSYITGHVILSVLTELH
jgi:hypothetical protein